MEPIGGSTAISAAGWKYGYMRVEWKPSGLIYEYGVEERVYTLLRNAPSKGRFMKQLMASGVLVN
jgi:hypothetical protein